MKLVNYGFGEMGLFVTDLCVYTSQFLVGVMVEPLVDIKHATFHIPDSLETTAGHSDGEIYGRKIMATLSDI